MLTLGEVITIPVLSKVVTGEDNPKQVVFSCKKSLAVKSR